MQVGNSLPYIRCSMDHYYGCVKFTINDIGGNRGLQFLTSVPRRVFSGLRKTVPSKLKIFLLFFFNYLKLFKMVFINFIIFLMIYIMYVNCFVHCLINYEISKCILILFYFTAVFHKNHMKCLVFCYSKKMKNHWIIISLGK